MGGLSQQAAVGGALDAGASRRAGRGWWRAWRARFGLAEVCGTTGAAAGFAAGYLRTGSLLTAAGLATICEVIGFYGCVGAKAAAAARRATVHLAGWQRLAAGAGHAVRQQLASCAIAEALDDLLIRPGCLAGAAWLLRPLPGGVWLGFVIGKAAADVAWYGMEASARWGVAWSLASGRRYRRGVAGRLWRFAAYSVNELRKIARHAPGSAVLVRLCTGVGGPVGDQGKSGARHRPAAADRIRRCDQPRGRASPGVKTGIALS